MATVSAIKGVESICNQLCFYIEKKKSFLLKYYSSVLLFIDCQPGIHKFVLQPNTVNSRLMDTSLVGTPC